MTTLYQDGWSIEADAGGVRVAGRDEAFDLAASEADRTTLRWGLFGWKLRRPGRPAERVRGMRRPVATKVRAAMSRVAVHDEVRAWVRRHDDLHLTCERGAQEGRWVPWDARDAFLADRRSDLPSRVRKVGATPVLAAEERTALAFGPEDMASIVDATNGRILADELTARKDFLASIESQPLTDEHERAENASASVFGRPEDR